MSALHVLAGAGPNAFTVVIHVATPNGNNSAGVAWSDAVKNSGLVTTAMPAGNGAGQIGAAEVAAIAAGTLIEGVFQFTDDPAWTNGQRNTRLDAEATKMGAELLARLAQSLKWFGATRG